MYGNKFAETKLYVIHQYLFVMNKYVIVQQAKIGGVKKSYKSHITPNFQSVNWKLHTVKPEL